MVHILKRVPNVKTKENPERSVSIFLCNYCEIVSSAVSTPYFSSLRLSCNTTCSVSHSTLLELISTMKL